MKNNLYILAFSALLLGACNSGSKENTKEESVDSPSEVAYSVDQAKVNWTAFKFTEKAGVGGTFTEVNVTAGGSGSAEEVLINGTFSIPENSVNSNNEIRDPKIKQQFFGNTAGDLISGKIISAENGKGQLELTMNSVSKTVEYAYTKADTALILNASIDVLNWDAQVGLDSLNIVCEALHKGEDGVSKLWPDVEVQVIIPAGKKY